MLPINTSQFTRRWEVTEIQTITIVTHTNRRPGKKGRCRWKTGTVSIRPDDEEIGNILHQVRLQGERWLSKVCIHVLGLKDRPKRIIIHAAYR